MKMATCDGSTKELRGYLKRHGLKASGSRADMCVRYLNHKKTMGRTKRKSTGKKKTTGKRPLSEYNLFTKEHYKELGSMEAVAKAWHLHKKGKKHDTPQKKKRSTGKKKKKAKPGSAAWKREKTKRKK
jgi:hypothetical protein